MLYNLFALFEGRCKLPNEYMKQIGPEYLSCVRRGSLKVAKSVNSYGFPNAAFRIYWAGQNIKLQYTDTATLVVHGHTLTVMYDITDNCG